MYNKIILILRKIISVSTSQIDDSDIDYKGSLIITTEYVGYHDIFENLELKYETNLRAQHRDYTDVTDIKKTKPVRRRLHWWHKVWHKIKDGVKHVVDDVKSVVKHIETAVVDTVHTIEDIVKILEGKKFVKNETHDYNWNYNYDSSTEKAVKEFYLDDGLSIFILHI